MSLLRLLRPGTHALADYAAALTLIIAAIVADGPAKAGTFGLVLGIGYLLISLMTRYPLGLVKVIPFPVHSAADYLGGLTLIAGPFLFNFYDNNKGLSLAYILTGIAVIAVSMITNYEWTRRDDQIAVDDLDRSRSRATATG
jgi:hypothetical protein